MEEKKSASIKAIIGLGNPGPKFKNTRHNIGFRVVDELADRLGASWNTTELMEYAQFRSNDHTILLLKPLTFMNDSGKVIPALQKKGIKPEEILVIHDELELPFGTIKHKIGGSAKGHNGLRSIMEKIGKEFQRMRVGIGRPEDRHQVGDYVLQNFSEADDEVHDIINRATEETIKLLQP